MIQLDGGYLEGGGQILRTGIALSAVTRQAVRVFNIRKGREKPGLRPQHLQGIIAAAEICGADVSGLHPGALEVDFSPRKIKGGRYSIDTKTAGSVSLILQTLIPMVFFADSPFELIIRGGTAVPFSPTIEYLKKVGGYFLGLTGISLNIEIKRHGFYPGGGGEIFVKVEIGGVRNIEKVERGAFEKIGLIAVASNHLKEGRVAERMISGFTRILSDVDADFRYVDTRTPGCFIVAYACFADSILGADELGRPGKRAELVGEGAARSLKKEIDSGAAVDFWMVDQIIPYMALSTYLTDRESKVKIPLMTKHAETNIWVVEKFLPVEFTLQENIVICRKKISDDG